MPYIKKSRRKHYDKLIKELAKRISEKNIADCTLYCGDWNYCVTKLIKETIKASNEAKSYALMNEIIGMLECCKQEWYRREIADYEDLKIQENGDV